VHLAAAVTLPAVLGLGLAACGTSGAAHGSASSSKAPVAISGKVVDKGTKVLAAGTTEVQIEAGDYYFEPTFVKAAPGQKLTVKLDNVGSVSHTFTSSSLGVDKELEPGQHATVEVTVPTSGAALFYCRFHQAMGQQGAIFSSAGQTATR